MSGNDKSHSEELSAFRELEMLVRHLGEELAMFRRRAIGAEAQIKDGGGSHPSKGQSAVGEHLTELEHENAALRTRLERAEERVRQMMDRVRFLRQQLQVETTGAKAGRS